MRAVYWCNKKWGSEKRVFFPSSMARKHFFAAPEAPIFFSANVLSHHNFMQSHD